MKQKLICVKDLLINDIFSMDYRIFHYNPDIIKLCFVSEERGLGRNFRTFKVLKVNEDSLIAKNITDNQEEIINFSNLENKQCLVAIGINH